MRFLKSILKKMLLGENNEIEANSVSIKKIITEKYDYSLTIHNDLNGLIWIGDGPRKNYINQSKEQSYDVNGIRITFSFRNCDDPSLIYLKFPVSLVENVDCVEKPPYFPSYSELTSEQRGVYWKLLSNPYNSDIDIGFVFILYYGLERHLFKGDYERAFNVILKLRDYHNNKSFQFYSGNCLILTCLMRKRIDLALKFMKSLDKDYEYNFSDNLFILCKYSLDIPITAKDIMRMSKSFEFEKTNYINSYPEIFESTLCEIIKEKCSKEDILIREFISDKGLKKIKSEEVRIFANMSIAEETIDVPQIIDSFKFKKFIYDLLDESHEQVKIKLRKLRKNGEIDKRTNEVKKSKTILIFDEEQETKILNQLENCKNILDKHFNLITIQDFYYKYRKVDSIYVNKCIQYCNEDISLLLQLQDSCYKRDGNYFVGRIPAFKRLTIIYEKQKEFEKAVCICQKAIKYYENIEMKDLVVEFNKRKVKLNARF